MVKLVFCIVDTALLYWVLFKSFYPSRRDQLVSLSLTEWGFDFSIFRALQSCHRHMMSLLPIDQKNDETQNIQQKDKEKENIYKNDLRTFLKIVAKTKRIVFTSWE